MIKTTRRILTVVCGLGFVVASSSPALGALSNDRGGSGNDHQGIHQWCGTDAYHTRLTEAKARHERFQERHARSRQSRGRGGANAQAMAGPTVRTSGKVVVIQDDGTIVAQKNEFDRSNAAIEFLKKKKKVRGRKSNAGINTDFGDRLVIGDDDTVVKTMPFSAKFYGTKYKTIYINSDGNITFVQADNPSIARDLGRFLNGPPRIAGLFGDLDPSATTGQAGVFYKERGGNVQITWNRVPEFGGLSSQVNTFQITIFKSGKVILAYGDVSAPRDTDQPSAIIGVSPGGAAGVQLIDVSADLPVKPTDLAIVERFSLIPVVDDFGVTQTFFDNFKDEYNHVIVWLDFSASLGGAFAYEINVKNDVRGIGLSPSLDFTSFTGSSGRLESFVQMGSIDQYPDNPQTTFLGTNSTLDILGQEAGHRWLSFVRANIDGQTTDEILGRDLAHWSFFLDSDASDMEGNDIQDNGGGSFTTVAATNTFSDLDRYIMGLIPPEQVGPMFFVRNGSNFERGSSPRINSDFTGIRADFTVQDIIAQEGARVPRAANANKTFNMAFVLVAQAGQPASAASIAKLKRIASQWVAYFKRETGGHGKVNTRLKKKR